MDFFNKIKGYKTIVVMAVPSLAPILIYILSVLQNDSFQATLISVLALFGITADPVVVGAWVITIIGIVGMLLRFVTTTPVATK